MVPRTTRGSADSRGRSGCRTRTKFITVFRPGIYIAVHELARRRGRGPAIGSQTAAASIFTTEIQFTGREMGRLRPPPSGFGGRVATTSTRGSRIRSIIGGASMTRRQSGSQNILRPTPTLLDWSCSPSSGPPERARMTSGSPGRAPGAAQAARFSFASSRTSTRDSRMARWSVASSHARRGLECS